MNRIGDYALIGDCHSLALVGRDGAIDWACFPRFDSPAAFCRMLDADRGGHFTVAPDAAVERVERAYLEDTNVLVTTFVTATGELEVTDCMPVTEADPADPASTVAGHAILRRVRCTGGQVTAAVTVCPRFEYASFVPRFRLASPLSGEIVGGADALLVECTRPLVNTGDELVGQWPLRSGEEAWVAVA